MTHAGTPRVGPGVVVAGRPAARNRLLVVALTLACLSYAVLQTFIVPALPEFQRDLGVGPDDTVWLVTVFILVSIVATLLLGSISDRVGHRRVLVWGLGIFLASTIGAIFAPGLRSLLLLRAVQGMGGVVFPCAYAIVRQEVSAGQRSAVIGVLSSTFGVGGVIALPLSGLLITAFGWRSLFVVSAVLIGASLVLVRAGVPVSPVAPSAGRTDVRGGVLAAIVVGAVPLAATMAGGGAWRVAAPVALAAGVVSVVLVRHLRRQADPLVDLALIRHPRLARLHLEAALAGSVQMGVLVVVVQLASVPYGQPAEVVARVSHGLGASPSEVGLFMLVPVLGMTAAAPLAGRFAREPGRSRVVRAGLCLTAVGCVWLALEPSRLVPMVLGVLLVAVGAMVVATIAPVAVLERAPVSAAGAASSINVVARQLGGVVGVQAGGIVLGAVTLSGTQVPARSAFQAVFVVAAVLALAMVAVPSPSR